MSKVLSNADQDVKRKYTVTLQNQNTVVIPEDGVPRIAYLSIAVNDGDIITDDEGVVQTKQGGKWTRRVNSGQRKSEEDHSGQENNTDTNISQWTEIIWYRPQLTGTKSKKEGD